MPLPETLLSRPDTAKALAELGFRVAETSLATMATRGGGPPYQKFGARVLYRWSDALAWAEGRLRPARSNTAEHRIAEAA